MTGLLIGVYKGLVLLATRVLSVNTPVAAATLAAVAVFTPLRRRVQQAVDRSFDRSRYDADQTVAAFAAGDPTAVKGLVVGVAAAITSLTGNEPGTPADNTRCFALSGPALFYAGSGLSRASAMRLRAQRREVLPNMPASLRSDSGFPT